MLFDKRPLYPQILLVCGSGRNTGKTTCITNIITALSAENAIISIKISPHIHHDCQGLVVTKSEHYTIYQETVIGTKDSQLFLQAGASFSYYIESSDEFVLEALNTLLGHIDNSNAIICESGALANLIKPGILLFMDYAIPIAITEKKQAYRSKANVVLHINHPKYEQTIQSIAIINGKWVFRI